MHQIQTMKCFSSWLPVVFAHYIEAKCWVENEDVVGAKPTGNAPTTSHEWSTIELPTKVRLILETWRYICILILDSEISQVVEIDSFLDSFLDNIMTQEVRASAAMVLV